MFSVHVYFIHSLVWDCKNVADTQKSMCLCVCVAKALEPGLYTVWSILLTRGRQHLFLCNSKE